MGCGCVEERVLRWADNSGYSRKEDGIAVFSGDVVGNGNTFQKTLTMTCQRAAATWRSFGFLWYGSYRTTYFNFVPFTLGVLEYSKASCSWVGEILHPGGPYQPNLVIEVWCKQQELDQELTGIIYQDGDKSSFLRLTFNGLDWVIQPRGIPTGSPSCEIFWESTHFELPTWMKRIPTMYLIEWDDHGDCDCDEGTFPTGYSGPIYTCIAPDANLQNCAYDRGPWGCPDFDNSSFWTAEFHHSNPDGCTRYISLFSAGIVDIGLDYISDGGNWQLHQFTWDRDGATFNFWAGGTLLWYRSYPENTAPGPSFENTSVLLTPDWEY